MTDINELSVFSAGDKNEAFAQYFIGQSYLNMLSTEQVVIGNVTFEPKSRNNWHIHHAEKGGGQMLLVTAGKGWMGQTGKRIEARRRRTHSGGRQALARRSGGFMVSAFSDRSPRREHTNRMV